MTGDHNRHHPSDSLAWYSQFCTHQTWGWSLWHWSNPTLFKWSRFLSVIKILCNQICGMFLSLEDKTPEHMGNRVARSTSQGRFAWMLDKMRKSHPSKKCRETVFSCFFSKEKHQSSLIGSQVSNLPKSKKICSFPTSPQKKCVAKVPQRLVCIYRIYIYIYIYILYTLYI